MNEVIKKYWIKQLEDGEELVFIENGCWGIQYKNQESTWFAVGVVFPDNVWEYLLDKREWKFYSEQEALKRIKLAMFW